MTDFYTPALLKRYEKKAARARFLSLALFALAVLIAVILCFFVSTGNAKLLQTAVIAEFTVLGWAAIFILNLAYFPARNQLRHIRACMSGERTPLTGACKTGIEMQIPKNISFISVHLSDENASHALMLNSLFKNDFPASCACVTVECVNSYIVSYEVQP